MKKIFIIPILLISCALCRCANEKHLYDDVPRIWLSGDVSQGAAADSVVFCFKLKSSSLQQYDLNVVAHIMGKAAYHDRRFRLEVDPQLTNVSPADYSLGEMVVPAGAYTGVCPVTVNKNVAGLDLSKERAVLALRAVPGDDFQVGDASTSTFRVIWINYLTRPDSWRVIESYVGPFTQARYKFVIDNSGLTEFSSLNGNFNKLNSFQSQMKRALLDYNGDPANAGREEGWPYMNDDGVTPLEIGSGVPY